ncbi:MAG: metalloregulator ArsR/SmtB family transcription factor [Azospirillaceae bacterium]
MNIEAMERNAGEAARLLKAMSNPNRLLVLCRLSQGERSVGELGRELGLSQSALSQHLARLRAEGLVTARRRSQSVFYALSSPDVRLLIDLLEARFCALPDNEEPPRPTPPPSRSS